MALRRLEGWPQRLAGSVPLRYRDAVRTAAQAERGAAPRHLPVEPAPPGEAPGPGERARIASWKSRVLFSSSSAARMLFAASPWPPTSDPVGQMCG